MIGYDKEFFWYDVLDAVLYGMLLLSCYVGIALLGFLSK